MADPARLLFARLATPLGLVAALALSPSPSAANQGLVARDGTLGSGALDVAAGIDALGQPADYLITPTLGEQHGAALFHSFARFGIGTGETATFTGPDPLGWPQSVENVISRVTGGFASHLDGTLRSTIPNAALWLINPNGLVFGAGAQLDVPGSFHAASADSLDFDAAGLVRFYADPSQPSVLSIAEPRAFGFLGSGASATPSLRAEGSTLAVPSGETLSLVARDGLALSGAQLSAPDGRVNLAAVRGAGGVVLGDRSAAEPLDVTSSAALGDVALTQAAFVDVSGSAPGAVFIRGGRVVVEGSRVLAEQHGASAPGGRIDVLASNSLDVDGGLISVVTDSAGDAGTIHLTGGNIVFRNGPGLLDFSPFFDLRNSPRTVAVGASAGTSSSGAGGILGIDARSLDVLDGATLGAMSLGAAASGRAGDIRVSADSVELGGGAVITTGSWGGQGDAGTLAIQAGTLTLDGADRYAILHASVEGRPATGGTSIGAPGTIEISAGSVRILNGGALENICLSCTSRRADRAPGAGVIRVHAAEMIVDGSNGTVRDLNDSHVLVFEGVQFDDGSWHFVEGEAGRIELVITGLLQLTQRGFLGSVGKAGEILVRAGSIRIADLSSGIYSGSADSGPPGTIAIQTGLLQVSNGAGIAAQAEQDGDGGSIAIEADSVEVDSGGLITTASYGAGDAGSIEIVARESIHVSAAGEPRFSMRDPFAWAPGISSSAAGGGNGGAVTLLAPDITVSDGAIVTTSTLFSTGRGGDVLLRGDRIHILGGALVDSASVGAQASAGHVSLLGEQSIEVSGRSEWGDVSRVGSFSLGSASAGEVGLRAARILVDGAAVASTALPLQFEGVLYPGGAGGTIRIDASELLVRGGGRVDSSSLGTGAAGTIEVHASDGVVLEGSGSAISTRTGGPADGGHVAIESSRIEVRDGAEVSARSETGVGDLSEIFSGLAADGLIGEAPVDATGNAGAVMLTGEEVLLSGSTLATSAESSDGGDISIVATRLVRLTDSAISASVGGGAGGSVVIDPVLVLLEDSAISASAAQLGGSGGRIAITSDLFFARGASLLDASAGDPALSGSVEIHSPDVDLSGALTALPAAYLDAATLMRERCAARRTGERAGSFTVRGVSGMPAQPDAPLMANAVAHAAGASAGAARETVAFASRFAGALLASRASCD